MFLVQLARRMRCPITKFVMHTISHFVFLLLLAIATFGLEGIDEEEDTDDEDKAVASVRIIHGNCNANSEFSSNTLKRKELCFKKLGLQHLELLLRPAHVTISSVQILIIFWIFGE